MISNVSAILLKIVVCASSSCLSLKYVWSSNSKHLELVHHTQQINGYWIYYRIDILDFYFAIVTTHYMNMFENSEQWSNYLLIWSSSYLFYVFYKRSLNTKLKTLNMMETFNEYLEWKMYDIVTRINYAFLTRSAISIDPFLDIITNAINLFKIFTL